MMIIIMIIFGMVMIIIIMIIIIKMIMIIVLIMILKKILLIWLDLQNSLMLQCVKHKILPLPGQWAEILVCFSREQFVDSYDGYDNDDDDDNADGVYHNEHNDWLVKGLRSLLCRK